MLTERKSPENRRQNNENRQAQQDPSCAAQRDQKPSAEIPNAHAAGVGAMGRNDEKLPSRTEDDATYDRDEPVY